MKESNLAPRYDPLPIESKWYLKWEEAGLFKADPDPLKPRFTIAIPPPNITGSLHMGHALCYPLQDAIGRFQRLIGKSVLILPGQDHAGIATQSVVEKQLRKQGTSGRELGREKFIERVWAWRKESGDTILHQLRALGCAFDWERTRFTLDEDYAKAVVDVFIEWFDRGLIFRGKRVVTWDPALKTSLSDLETERKVIPGKLYYLKYPFSEGGGHFIVATTRPETIFADVAIAVNVSDKRYLHLVGKQVQIPLTNRKISIIADIYPDPEFGTGALKITPAHDANDFAVGQRHNLPMPMGIDESGKLTDLAGQYSGLDRFEARKQVVTALEQAGLIEKVEDHEIALAISERSGEPVEPLLSEQWFVDQTMLANQALEMISGTKIEFVPPRYNELFKEWLENIHEWCISRQLWWGHRIPIFYSEDGDFVAAHNAQVAEKKLGKKIMRQDDDVLDTWFSSGLWPFVLLGWPGKTKEMDERYPTSLLVTDRNIINLWVSRMTMMSVDLLKQIPFHQVMIYATVLNEKGQRMAKTLGTGVDPMTVVDTLGADVLRWTLQSQTGTNQNLKYSERKTEDARNFCNKIWNASRFVLMNLGDEIPAKPDGLEPIDAWILSQLAVSEQEIKDAYEGYDFIAVCQALYRFFWNSLCDKYIEASKSRLLQEDTAKAPRWVLVQCIHAFLTYLHPVMPHISEEIYSYLPIENKSPYLMRAEWYNCPDSWVSNDLNVKFDDIFDVVRELRALRSQLDVSPTQVLHEGFYEGNLQGMEAIIAGQARIERLRMGRPEGEFVSGVSGGVKLWMPIAASADPERELEKIMSALRTTQAELDKAAAILDNPQFRERAKPEAVDKQKVVVTSLTKRLEVLNDQAARHSS